MSVFFQKEINSTTRLGIWEMEESESFFIQKVPLHRQVTHPHKKLQHLAGRFLLQYLFPEFPAHLIQIADTKKPYLADEAYHFSISHCGDYAAAIVSTTHRVGIDIELPVPKILAVQQKFVTDAEMNSLHPLSIEDFTQIWSAKEAVFKWYGKGAVDFKEHIQLRAAGENTTQWNCFFSKTQATFPIHIARLFPLCLSYITTSAAH